MYIIIQTEDKHVMPRLYNVYMERLLRLCLNPMGE